MLLHLHSGNASSFEVHKPLESGSPPLEAKNDSHFSQFLSEFSSPFGHLLPTQQPDNQATAQLENSRNRPTPTQPSISRADDLTSPPKLPSRKSVVRDLILNAERFPLSPSQFQLGIKDSPVDVPVASLMLLKIAQRAMEFNQALKAEYCLGAGYPTHVWWVTGAMQDDRTAGTAEPLFSLKLRRYCTQDDSLDEFITPNIQALVACGYSQNSPEYVVSLKCVDGSTVRLSYDAVLADESHTLTTPFQLDRSIFQGGWTPPKFDWGQWLSSPEAPKRHSSCESSANRTFERNILNLKNWVLAAPSNQHLTWSTAGTVYKFVEHQLLKLNQGGMGFSHRERLTLMHFTWGIQRSTAKEMFGPTLQ